MPIWKVLPITDEPEIKMTQWQVIELPNGDRHFVGYNYRQWEGRVSSKIEYFDPKTMSGITESNRRYQLEGRPGHNKDAAYVWAQWMRINGVGEFKDVSKEVEGAAE